MSLQVKMTSLPSQLKEADKTSSGKAKLTRHSPVPTFHTQTLLSLPQERRMFWAEGFDLI